MKKKVVKKIIKETKPKMEIKDFTNILAKMKIEWTKKEKKMEFPKFSVSEKFIVVELPSGKEIDFKYHLIRDSAIAHLKYDKDKKELIYNVIEPILTKEEIEIYKKIIGALLEVLDVELSAIKKREETVIYLEKKIQEILTEYDIKLNKESYLKIMYFVYRNFVGLNEIEPILHDPYVEDISCDGTGIPIYIVHRKYGSIKTNLVYNDADVLRQFVVKLAERCGRFISYAEPLLDGTLPDGSRVQASFSADVTTRGPTFTIRKFVEEPLSPIDIMNSGTASSEVLAYLWLAVESGASILVGGGAATGKTTFLNALSMFIPPQAKIVSVEDTRELNIPHDNWIPSVTRAGFAKGYGEVTMFDLLKEAFRQSPNYVIVGEVRGEEAYVMFQGMAAGMPAMGTMHAGKVEDIINRLQTPPINLAPSLIETLDIVIIMVHAKEKGESARRVKEIIEIEEIDSKTGSVRTNKAYNWLPSEDIFESRGYSWLLQEISKLRGESADDLQKELMRRKKILEWMQKNKISNFKDVVGMISEYYRNPEKVLKQAKIK
jgi:flagellar protein FlaI